MKNNKIFWLGIGSILIFGAVLLYGSRLISKKEKAVITLPQNEETGILKKRSGQVTLTPEEEKIIAQIKTHKVLIENGKLSPPNLTIKLYDQVEWENKDEKACQLEGEGWGNIPLQPGKRFTQSFEKTGLYPYSCGSDPQLRGTITVE